ncbi:unnamed protein product [Caenorhabditis brenneri]
MYSQNNNMEPAGHYCKWVSLNEANQLKLQVQIQATEIIRLKKIERDVAKLYPILEQWETTGNKIYHQHALKMLKSRQPSNSGSEVREKNKEVDEIKEANEANEKLDNDLVEAYTLITNLCNNLISVENKNKKLLQEKEETKRNATDANEKLQAELTDAYGLISKLEKQDSANQAAMKKQSSENQASLLHNSETIAQLRGKVENLETFNRTLKTEKEQVEKKLEESQKKLKLERDYETDLEMAKKIALDAEEYRQTQQTLVESLEKEKNAMRNGLKNVLEQVKNLKEDMTGVATEASNMRNEYKKFSQAFLTQTQELNQLRETCRTLKNSIQKSDEDKLKKKEEKLKKYQEEFKRKTERMEKDMAKIKRKRGMRSLLIDSAAVEEKKPRVEE